MESSTIAVLALLTSICAAELLFSTIKISEHHCSSFLRHFWEHAARTISHFIAPVQ